MAVKRNTFQVQAASEFLKSFANPTRLRLLCVLKNGECSVGALAHAAGVPVVSASQQLANLRRDRLVVARRCRQAMLYRLADDNVGRFIEALSVSFCPSNAPQGAKSSQGGSCDTDSPAQKRL